MSTITYKQLRHFPGDRGLPYFGHFFPFLANASKFYQDRRKKFGDVFIFRTPFGWTVTLCGPTATKFFLVENNKFTSSKEAWDNALSELFPNGLMLMDGDRHRYHRSIMQEAFKKSPMQGYLDIMPAIITKELDKLNGINQVELFPFFKNLTLQLAGRVFFGLELKEDLVQINRSITNIVEASGALPFNLPFSKFRKGIKGRKALVRYFRSVLPERRRNPGKDLMSKFCLATSEEGAQFTDEEIIDHLIFVLMAAHDTTAITLTLMSYFLAKHPQWQDQLRAEALTLNREKTDIQLNDLRQLEKISLVMKETLRLHPPLILVPRKLEKAMEFEGYRFPANTFINLLFQLTHIDERTWTNPNRFDPERFNKQRNEHQKCPYAYAPFGAGKHHCIGFAFAEMQIKLVLTEFLTRFKISVPNDYECELRDVPLKQPKDNLPVFLESIHKNPRSEKNALQIHR